MAVKIRKVGNSYVLTIPPDVMFALDLHDGQEMEVTARSNALEYRALKPNVKTVDWEKYETRDRDLRDGLSPDEYVRKLRENDRE